MTTTKQLALALPFVFLAACSNNRSASDTATSAGVLDTSAFSRDTNPVKATDTSKKAMPMDSMMKDSAMMKDSTMMRHSTSKKSSTKTSTTKKPSKP